MVDDYGLARPCFIEIAQPFLVNLTLLRTFGLKDGFTTSADAHPNSINDGLDGWMDGWMDGWTDGRLTPVPSSQRYEDSILGHGQGGRASAADAALHRHLHM